MKNCLAPVAKLEYSPALRSIGAHICNFAWFFTLISQFALIITYDEPFPLCVFNGMEILLTCLSSHRLFAILRIEQRRLLEHFFSWEIQTINWNRGLSHKRAFAITEKWMKRVRIPSKTLVPCNFANLWSPVILLKLKLDDLMFNNVRLLRKIVV